jgi:hypothetical protein
MRGEPTADVSRRNNFRRERIMINRLVLHQHDLPLSQRLGENNISDAALFREFGDIPTPTLVKVIRPKPRPSASPGQSYEETRWARLSPAFRAAHNRLRMMRGLSPVPEPAVDLYVPPQAAVRPFDPGDRETAAAVRGFIGQPMLGGRGGEGFTINGQPVDGDRARPAPPPTPAPFAGSREGEGFTINGTAVRGAAVRRG